MATEGVTPNLIVKNASPWRDGEVRDLYIAGDRFIAPPNSGDVGGADFVDAAGRLCVAGFVEPHIHLDKAMINEDVRPNISGTLDEAIEIIW